MAMGFGAILGWIYLGYETKKEQAEAERKAQERADRFNAEYWSKRETSDYNYDKLELQIKKTLEARGKITNHDRRMLITLISLRNGHFRVDSKGKDYFYLYQKVDVADKEIEEFHKIRGDWEDKVLGRKEEG